MHGTLVRVLGFLLICTSALVASAGSQVAVATKANRASNPSISEAAEVATPDGAMGYSISIEVPRGRNGIEPALTLSYSSSLGNALAGYGWTIPVTSIRRRVEHGRGVDPGSDAYELVRQGVAEALILIDPITNEYTLETPSMGDVVRIFRETVTVGSETFTQWRLLKDDGEVQHFGGDSLYLTSWPTPLIGGTSEYEWLLRQVEDWLGNRMEFFYTISNLVPRLDRIAYGANPVKASLPNHTAEILFVYDSARTDPWNEYVPVSDGVFEMIHTSLLLSIESYTLDGANRSPFAAYALAHEFSENGRVNKLVSVTRLGDDGVANSFVDASNAPSTQFTYSDPIVTHPGSQQPTPGAGYFAHSPDFAEPSGYSFSQNSWKYVPGDFDGDSRMDMLHLRTSSLFTMWSYDAGTQSFLLNDVSSDALDCTSQGTCPEYSPASNAYRYHVGDFNGDGKDDLFHVVSSTAVNVWLSEGGLSFSSYPETPLLVPGHDLGSGDYNFHVGDFNGDGLDDVVNTPANDIIRVWLSNGDGTFAIQSAPPGISENWLTNAKQTWAFDANGDGLSDVLHLTNNSTLSSFISDGSGGFYELTSGGDFASKLFLFGNFNDDGLTDFLIWRPFETTSRVHLATSTGQFINKLAVYSLEVTGDDQTVLAANLNGDARTDLLLIDGAFPAQNGGLVSWVSEGDLGFDPVYETWFSIEGATIQRPELLFAGDLTGDGLTDLVQFESGTSQSDPFVRAWTADPSTSDPLLLLTEVKRDGEMLQRTEYAYASELMPSNFHLALPVQKQTTVYRDVGVSHSTTFTYDVPRLSTSQGRFLGFAEVHSNNLTEGTSTVQTYATSGSEDALPIDTRLYDSGGALLYEIHRDYEDLNGGAGPTEFVALTHSIETDHSGTVPVVTEAFMNIDPVSGQLQSLRRSGDGSEDVTDTSDWELYGDWNWRRTRREISGSQSGVSRCDHLLRDPATGLLTSEIQGCGTANDIRLTHTYYGTGQIATTTDGRGNVVEYIYDTSNSLYLVELRKHPGGGLTLTQRFEADPGTGINVSIWDANNNLTQRLLDPFGRIENISAHDGDLTSSPKVSEVSYIYEDAATGVPNPLSATETRILDSTANPIEVYTKTVEYDFAGNRKRVIESSPRSADPLIMEYDYTRSGQLRMAKGPYFQSEGGSSATTKLYSYDLLGRPTDSEVQFAGGIVRTTSTVHDGLTQTTTDGEGRSGTFVTDFLGRALQITEYPNGSTPSTMSFSYDASGNVRTHTYPTGLTSTLTSANNGVLSTVQDPYVGTSQYYVDSSGNPHVTISSDGSVVFSTFDGVNRELSRGFSQSLPTQASFEYDDNTVPNSQGMQTASRNTFSEQEVLEYDALGRIMRIRQRNFDRLWYELSYAYDTGGRLRQIDYPAGAPIAYLRYNYHPGTSLLKEILNPSGAALVRLPDYDAHGQPTRIEYGNGLHAAFTPGDGSGEDPDRTQRYRVGPAVPPQDPFDNLLFEEYSYDSTGNLTRIEDLRYSGGKSGSARAFDYDHAARLASIVRETTGIVEASYTMNPMGDLLSKFEMGESLAFTYASGSTDRLIQVTKNSVSLPVEYGPRGNIKAYGVVSDDGSTLYRYEFDYDQTNQVIAMRFLSKPSVSPPGFPVEYMLQKFVVYSYDAEGSVVIRDEPNVSYDQYYLGAFENPANDFRVYVNIGNQRIAEVSSGSTHYIHYDLRGNVRGVSDSGGAILDRRDYGPYGRPKTALSSFPVDLGFMGVHDEPEFGVVLTDRRIYSTVLGRFLSADPLIVAKRTASGSNAYGYARGNPYRFYDPSGEFPWVAFFTAVGVGAAVGGTEALLNNQPFLQGLGYGALRGAMSGLALGFFPPAGISLDGFLMGQTVASMVSGGLEAHLRGGDFGAGAWAGWATARLTYTPPTIHFNLPQYRRLNLGIAAGTYLLNHSIRGAGVGAAAAVAQGGNAEEVIKGAKRGALTGLYGGLLNGGVGILTATVETWGKGYELVARDGAWVYQKVGGADPHNWSLAIVGDKNAMGEPNIVAGKKDPAHTIWDHEYAHFRQSIGNGPYFLSFAGTSFAIAQLFNIPDLGWKGLFQYQNEPAHTYGLHERWLITVPGW